MFLKTFSSIFLFFWTPFLIIYWYSKALFRLIIPPKMKSIDGEIILVTGAAGGIGRELCHYIVKCGINIKLIIWDLNYLQLEKLANELLVNGQPGLQVLPVEVDISSRENIEAAYNQTKESAGSPTIIFNNAGILKAGSFLNLSDHDIEATFQVNLLSQLWILRQSLPDMMAKNHGRIVNICSVGGLLASANSLPYFASKFAVNGYTESLRAELILSKYNGIHLTSVYSFYVKTQMINPLQVHKGRGSWRTFFCKLLKPEEVARKTVDGMRREYEHVYLPFYITLIVLIMRFTTKEMRKVMVLISQSRYAFKENDNNGRVSDCDNIAVKVL